MYGSQGKVQEMELKRESRER